MHQNGMKAKLSEPMSNKKGNKFKIPISRCILNHTILYRPTIAFVTKEKRKNEGGHEKENFVHEQKTIYMCRGEKEENKTKY